MIGFKSLPTNKRKLLLVLCRIWFGGTGSEYQQNGKKAENEVFQTCFKTVKFVVVGCWYLQTSLQLC